MKKRKTIAIWLMVGLFLPILPVAALAETGLEPPETIEEAKTFGLGILRSLPEAVKKIWQEQVLPLWQRMWQWFKEQLRKLWHWFLGLLGREVERVKPEIEEKVEQTKQSLWQRFKNLFK